MPLCRALAPTHDYITRVHWGSTNSILGPWCWGHWLWTMKAKTKTRKLTITNEGSLGTNYGKCKSKKLARWWELPVLDTHFGARERPKRRWVGRLNNLIMFNWWNMYMIAQAFASPSAFKHKAHGTILGIIQFRAQYWHDSVDSGKAIACRWHELY